MVPPWTLQVSPDRPEQPVPVRMHGKRHMKALQGPVVLFIVHPFNLVSHEFLVPRHFNWKKVNRYLSLISHDRKSEKLGHGWRRMTLVLYVMIYFGATSFRGDRETRKKPARKPRMAQVMYTPTIRPWLTQDFSNYGGVDEPAHHRSSIQPNNTISLTQISQNFFFFLRCCLVIFLRLLVEAVRTAAKRNHHNRPSV